MKFRLFAGAAASVALLASTAAAQVCQGDLAFRASPVHIGGALGISDHTTAFGGGATFGHPRGLYGGGNLGMLNYDNGGGNSFVLGGGVGYSMPLTNRSVWQLCPGGTLNLGFGPSQDLGGGNTMHVSSQTFTLGASIGRSLPLNKDITMLPFGSAALGHTAVHATVNGISGSNSDSYLLLGFGAGFQFSPTFVVKPAISLAAGADIIDDTVFSLGITFALPR